MTGVTTSHRRNENIFWPTPGLIADVGVFRAFRWLCSIADDEDVSA